MPPSSDPVHGTHTPSDTEPLLGRPGDVSQGTESGLLTNLILGTGVIAQFGIWLLVTLIWASVFMTPLSLFAGHPLAQSLAVLLFTQAILTLQPTHTGAQKRSGARVHAALNGAGVLLFVVGISIIEYNKISQHRPQFHVAHAWFGLASAIAIVAQAVIGLTMWAAPKLYGGEDRAKAVWKYHRWSGYAGLVLLLATVASATGTDYNAGVLKLKLWAVLLLSALVVLGVFPRIKKAKLGL